MMNEKIVDLRAKANRLPHMPGVYLMKDKTGKIIYVGKAKALKNRVTQYFRSDKNHALRVIQMVSLVYDFDYIVTDSEFEALVLENSLIKQYNPKYNVKLKDAKGYSYIKITSPPWTRISAVKQINKDGSKYLGPYMSSFMVRSIVDEAVKVFKLPTCNKKFPAEFGRARPCLNYYIKQCDAPCKGKMKESEHENRVQDAIEFIKKGNNETIKSLTTKMNEAAEGLDFERAAMIRDRINAIEKVGERQKVVQSNIGVQDVIGTAKSEDKVGITILKFRAGRLCDRQDYVFEQMESLEELVEEFIERYYEEFEIPTRITLEFELLNKELIEKWLSDKAGKKVELFIPKIGEQSKLLEMCKRNAAEKLSHDTESSGKELSTMDELSRLLGLKNPPKYIEAYDISNLAGGENVGGMVVFENTRPLKSAYRRFKIKTVVGQDDYESMREVIRRRFAEYEEKKETGEGFGRMPDLILLDGGKGHVNAIFPILKEMEIDVPLFGMVKDNKHKTRAIASSGGEVEIQSVQKAFNFISSVQDEVHRFAIGYHKTLRKKANISSSLIQIEGIGMAKAKALLKHFKTVKNIKEASAEELLQVKGITKKNAESIIKHL